MAPAETITCRPPRSHWLAAVLPVVLGLLVPMSAAAPGPKGPPSPGEILFAEVFSVLCLLCLCVLLWWLLRACVAGDNYGLRWRGLGGWKSATWDTVSDYYEALPTWAQQSDSRNGRPKTRLPLVASVAETPNGKCGVTSAWSNADALRELITRNAINSRSVKWDLKGTRTCDPWPRTFDYNTRENRWAPRIWLKLFVTFVVCLFIRPALWLAPTAQLIGWAQTLAVAGVYTLLAGSLGLIFLLPLAQYRAANRRKAERITVSFDGIAFESGARRVQAVWADVTGYHSESSQGLGSRFVIETWQGEFDFLSSIGSAALLQAIIPRFATDATSSEWRSRVSDEALGGEAARWTGGKSGVGSRFYHYRTRVHRVLLFGGAVLCGALVLLVVSISLGWLPGNVPPAGAALAGVVWTAILFIGLRAYLGNGIAVDENGLTQRTVFGSRFLAWEQVQGYEVTPLGSSKVIGRTQTLGFSSEIVGYKELMEEIERRTEHCLTP